MPAALICLDRVVSAEPDFRKYWLLHSMEEPRVNGASATIDRAEHGASGRLILDVLLPEAANADLGKIGGPGKEYWVFGTNYTNDVTPERLARTSMESGAWRLELSPRRAAAEDLFLTVMQTTDRRSSHRWPVRRLDAAGRVGCVLEGPDSRWAILVRQDSRRSAESVQLAVAGSLRCRFLVTDLAAGRWQAQRTGGESRTIEDTADAGAAWIEGAAGTWTLTRL